MVREERDLGFRGRGKATEDDILVVIIIIIIIYLIHLGEGERMEMKAGKRINDTFVLLLQSEQQTNKQTGGLVQLKTINLGLAPPPPPPPS
jgi:hypothetical protein